MTKKVEPMTLVAILDGIRRECCVFCHHIEYSKLPEKIAMVSKEVDDARAEIHALRRKHSKASVVAKAERALYRVEANQTQLDTQLRSFMIEAGTKLVNVMATFGRLSDAATTGNYNPKFEEDSVAPGCRR